MAQRNIEILIGRLITDEAFRSTFRTNGLTALTRFMESGYELTLLEVTALRATPANLWERVAAHVDPRLQKTWLGGPMETFEVSAHMTVRSGQLAGFKRQAAECIRITREKDTHTLRYDWFLSSDATECEVRESYTSPEGLLEHNRNILDARIKLFEDYADNHFMTFYGQPIPQLIELVKAHHMERQVKWFSFVGGLDSPGTANGAVERWNSRTDSMNKEVCS